MSGLSVFFNHKMINKDDSFLFANVPVRVGDWFFTPLRCLSNGEEVTITNKDNVITLKVEKEYYQKEGSWDKPKRTYLRLALAVVFLLPGLILGTLFKGLGYLTSTIRKRHELILTHYIPIDRTVGGERQRLNLAQIRLALDEQRKQNHLDQATNNLIIYAQEGTNINDDPGILDLNPRKIVLVGAKIVHEPSAFGRMDDMMVSSSDWESGVRINHSTYVSQHKVKSVDEALQDILPKKSFFSSERYKRVYVV